MDNLDYIICSPEILKKLIPDFVKQVNSIETTDISEGKAKINKSVLAISNRDIEGKLPDNWDITRIDEEQLNFRLSGCVSLRQLVNGIPIPIFLRDTKGYFIGCNPDFTDFMGIEERDLIGKTAYEVVPLEQAQEYEHRDRELIDRPHIQVYEGEITRKNGETKEVIFRKTILLDEAQNPSAIVGVIIDISKRVKIERANWDYKNKLEDMVIERTTNLSKANIQLKNEIELRRQADTALKESEELFKTIFNSTYEGIILQELNGKIINVNNKVLEMVGIEQYKFYHFATFADLSAPNNNEEVLRHAWYKALAGESHFFEWTIVNKKSMQYIPTEVFIQKINIGDKELILTNIRDISERKDVEKLLLQEHNKVKTALKHEMLLSTIASILNSTDKFFDVLDSLLKTSKDTMHLTNIGFHSFQEEHTQEIEHIIDFFDKPKDDKYNAVIASIKLSLENNKAIYFANTDDLTEQTQHFLQSRNASMLCVLPIKIASYVSGALLFETDEFEPKTSKFYGLFNTISNMIANAWERYILTQQRIESEKHNIKTVQLLESSSKLASIGVMAAGITHEINQPLNAIKIMADGILFWDKRNPNLLPESFLDKISKITQAVNRIDSIIKHMRSFWMPRTMGANEEFMVHTAIDNAMDIISSQLSSHGIITNVIYDNKNISLQGDIIHLEQVIINLCLNAMHALDKSNQAEKKITISLEQIGESIHLKVQDNGPGLPDCSQEDLFDPFYSTKQPGEGMGLGLAIVKQFIDNFKGRIICSNDKDGGAVFEIII